jgi:hypothetical protein
MLKRSAVFLFVKCVNIVSDKRHSDATLPRKKSTAQCFVMTTCSVMMTCNIFLSCPPASSLSLSLSLYLLVCIPMNTVQTDRPTVSTNRQPLVSPAGSLERYQHTIATKHACVLQSSHDRNTTLHASTIDSTVHYSTLIHAFIHWVPLWRPCSCSFRFV